MSELYKPSECERNGSPRAFEYELKMPRFAIEEHSKAQEKFLKNALVECVLLHARNLLDFFWQKQPPKNDDICAGHFIGDFAKNRAGNWWRSCNLPYLRSQKAAINKSMSHLTYERIGAEYKWDLDKTKDEIEAAYAEFLHLLPEKDREKWESNKAF